jgi:hypothetical protein
VPDQQSRGAQDGESSYLHLIVNWFEISTTAEFADLAAVERHVRRLPFYRWIYKTVIGDWPVLKAMYTEYGIVPVPAATSMSAEDLKLAARTS